MKSQGGTEMNPKEAQGSLMKGCQMKLEEADKIEETWRTDRMMSEVTPGR